MGDFQTNSAVEFSTEEKNRKKVLFIDQLI